MNGKKHLVLAMFVGALAACSEPSAPPAAPPVLERGQLHTLRWAPGEAPRQFSVSSVEPSATVNNGLQAAPPAPTEISDSVVSFWAYTDHDASVQVNYLASDGSWKPYVKFSVPAGSLSKRPDGSDFAAVDSIEISMTLSTTEIEVDLQPNGLQFSFWNPASLKMFYGGTNPDFNGDGIVNFLDDYIEQFLLGMYTRPTPEDAWEPLSALQSLILKRFSANIRHFCGYAVSW
jgi:hypothetical protein